MPVVGRTTNDGDLCCCGTSTSLRSAGVQMTVAVLGGPRFLRDGSIGSDTSTSS